MIVGSHLLKRISPNTQVPVAALFVSGVLPAIIICMGFVLQDAVADVGMVVDPAVVETGAPRGRGDVDVDVGAGNGVATDEEVVPLVVVGRREIVLVPRRVVRAEETGRVRDRVLRAAGREAEPARIRRRRAAAG